MFESLEIIEEQFSHLLQKTIIFFFIQPVVSGIQDCAADVVDGSGYGQIEHRHVDKLTFLQTAIMNGINNCTGVFQRNSLSNAVLSSDPSSVEQPDVSAVFLNPFSQEGSISIGMEGQESLTEAR